MEADYLLAQQGEVGEAVAGGEEVGDDVEAAVRHRAEQLLVARDLGAQRGEQDPGVRAVLLEQVGAARDAVDVLLVDHPRAGHENETVESVARLAGHRGRPAHDYRPGRQYRVLEALRVWDHGLNGRRHQGGQKEWDSRGFR